MKVIIVVLEQRETDSGCSLYGELEKIEWIIVIYKYCDEYLNLNIVYISVYLCIFEFSMNA